jgi:hypothetical protein
MYKHMYPIQPNMLTYLRQCTYTWYHVSTPIYAVLTFTYFNAVIRMINYLCAHISIRVHMHLRPYTHYTCLHTSALVYLYIFTYNYTRIPAYLHISTSIPAYQGMSTYFCARIPMHVSTYIFMYISMPAYLGIFRYFYTRLAMHVYRLLHLYINATIHVYIVLPPCIDTNIHSSILEKIAACSDMV